VAEATRTRAERRNVNAPGYTVRFALVVCLACAAVVAVAAVLLEPRQAANARLYMEKNVLIAAGLAQPGDALSIADVDALFERYVEARLVDLQAGELVPENAVDARAFDQRAARNDPATSRLAPTNKAGIHRLPDRAVVYFIRRDDAVEQLVLAVEGLGMWGTMYGFVSLDPDANTVGGLTYYEHRETPGLGAEVASPVWQRVWQGRKIYDDQWQARITVIKGIAGDPEDDPLRVDGLTGATVTSNAVTNLMQFWLGPHGYGPFLDRFREGEAEI